MNEAESVRESVWITRTVRFTHRSGEIYYVQFNPSPNLLKHTLLKKYRCSLILVSGLMLQYKTVPVVLEMNCVTWYLRHYSALSQHKPIKSCVIMRRLSIYTIITNCTY